MSVAVSVKSAGRALAVLDYLSAVGSATFAELSDALSLPKSSASALLGTMHESGWIERDAQRRYRVGLRAWQVGRTYRGHDDLVEKAKPLMDTLSRDIGETVQLARLDGMENVYIAISESAHPMRLVSSVGMRLPSHATGIGKALLSQLAPAERAQRVSAAPLARLTTRTVVEPERLLAILSECALSGFALDDEEFVEGCRCVAVPLHTGALGVITAMSITMPLYRSSKNWPDDLIPALQRTAQRLQSELGLHSEIAHTR